MADGAERDSIMKNRVAILPGKRVGIAEEVVPVILLLVINDCMMGEVVHVDGAAASCHKARSISYRLMVKHYPHHSRRRTPISRVGRPK
jgi:hypothetical protein